LHVFELISLADLEADYINPIDLCNRINQFVLPEFVSHAIITTLYFLSGYWLSFLINAPLAGFHTYSFLNKKLNLDATSIFSKLDEEKKKSYVKLGFYMLAFFYSLYSLIYCLVKDVISSKEAANLANTLV